MAEALLNDIAKRKGWQVKADSAGLSAAVGAGISEYAERALAEIGIDGTNHRPTLFDPLMAERYDLIFAMTPSHAAAISRMAPSLAEKVHVLGTGISDPFGMDYDDYVRTRDQISEELIQIAEEFGFDTN